MYPKRKPEDESVTKLKQLGLDPANKRCFDCGQRGPTYINVTIGSFVCSTCGGLLRGIAPPQRIKSVSMATFTPVEVQVVEQRGNEACKNIWLGKWDKPEPPTFDKNTETGRRDFLSDKYEKKLWYVDPSQATVKKEVPESSKSLKQIAEKQTSSPIAVPRSRGSSVISIKTPPLIKASPGTGMVRSSSLPLTAQQSGAVPHPSPRQLRLPRASQQPAVTQSQTPPVLPPRGNVHDLLTGGTADPFQSSQTAPGSQNFANFDAFCVPSSGPVPAPVSPFVSSGVLQPHNPNQPKQSPPRAGKGVKAAGEADRYAALADLDNTLRSLTFSSAAGSDTNPFTSKTAADPQYPISTFATQPKPQSSSNPFIQGGWSKTNGVQPGYGQGGVSVVNNSSIMSTGLQPGTPSNTPRSNFPAANSVGTFDQQYTMYHQNQFSQSNQFGAQQFAPTQTAQQQFAPAQTAQQQFAAAQPVQQQFASAQAGQQQFAMTSQQQQFLAQQQVLAAQMATQPGMQQKMFMMQAQSHNPFMMTASQKPTNPFT